MPFSISQTNAEDVIGATDAVLQKHDGADVQLIADFLTTTTINAQNAANMAVELGLIRYDGTSLFLPKLPYSNYLVTSNAVQKASVLRFFLEEYEPYKYFKNRLLITSSSGDAANQIKAILGLTAHKTEINHTFISLGTFTNSIVTAGAGRYIPNTNEDYEFISIVEEVIHNRQTAELKIRERLGEEIIQWIDNNDVYEPIVTAFQRAANTQIDERAPILHAGNAIESFLTQVANQLRVNIAGANGINAKIDRITGAGNLTVKHKNIVKYLGHIRNASDHGVDTDIGQAWSISNETGVEYVHVALTAIRSIYDCINGNYII
jgi:hypothetical protein